MCVHVLYLTACEPNERYAFYFNRVLYTCPNNNNLVVSIPVPSLSLLSLLRYGISQKALCALRGAGSVHFGDPNRWNGLRERFSSRSEFNLLAGHAAPSSPAQRSAAQVPCCEVKCDWEHNRRARRLVVVVVVPELEPVANAGREQDQDKERRRRRRQCRFGPKQESTRARPYRYFVS